MTISEFSKRLAGLALAAFLATITGAQAAVIGPVGVSSPDGNYGGIFDLSKIIDQSGLSAGYVSGVTDFGSYTSTTTSTYLGDAGFTSTKGSLPQVFTFDLGYLTNIRAIAVWNTGSVGALTSFELLADTDSDFGNGVTASLIEATPLATSPGETQSAQVFSFAAMETRFVHFRGLTSLQRRDYYGLNEVVFDGSVVPLPSGLPLLLGGLAALAFLRRRRA